MISKSRRYRNKKITDSARGMDCQIRSGACNGNSETTVFAHLGGGGMGTKNSDLIGAYACSSCHDLVDGRVQSQYSPDYVKIVFYEGVFRTQKMLLDLGLVKI